MIPGTIARKACQLFSRFLRSIAAEQARSRLDDDNSVRFYAAEIYRLLGETCLRSDQNLDQAKHYFARGLEIARQQKAKSFELKLCLSLCNSYALRGGAGKDHSELKEIYRSFNEGFDTADLVKAKAMLENENIRLAGTR